MSNLLTKAKDVVNSHKGAVTAFGTAAVTALSCCPVFAEGVEATGYLDATVFQTISANIVKDITNLLPQAWPIFGLMLAVGIGMRIFRRVC